MADWLDRSRLDRGRKGQTLIIERGLLLREIGPGKDAITCPFASEHSEDTSDTSTVYFYSGPVEGRHEAQDRTPPGSEDAPGSDSQDKDGPTGARTDGAKATGGGGGASTSGGGGPPIFITATTLWNMQHAPTRWGVPGILPEGVALFCGKPKTGKSWLAIGLAIALLALSMSRPARCCIWRWRIPSAG